MHESKDSPLGILWIGCEPKGVSLEGLPGVGFVQHVSSLSDAREQIERGGPDVAILHGRPQDVTQLEALPFLRRLYPRLALVLVAATESSHLGARAVYLGADEVTGPHAADSPTALLGAIRMALRRRGLRQKVAADHRRFQAEAVTDSLTGAYNRRFFDSQLAKEISRSQRYHSPVSLLMVDVDHFKGINDSFGHQVGDRVLQEMVQVIRRTIRIPDLLARFGGEEFALILPSTDPRGAAHLGERLLQRIACHPFPVGEGGAPQMVTVSIGLATYDGSVQDFGVDEFVALVDRALYRAKQEGRNRLARIQPQRSESAEAES